MSRTPAPADFTRYPHPVMAVACPDCLKRPGVMCYRPSGHNASDFHRSRKLAADDLFIAQHGEQASIERTAEGWRIEPFGYRPANTSDAQTAQIALPF